MAPKSMQLSAKLHRNLVLNTDFYFLLATESLILKGQEKS